MSQSITRQSESMDSRFIRVLVNQRDSSNQPNDIFRYLFILTLSLDADIPQYQFKHFQSDSTDPRSISSYKSQRIFVESNTLINHISREANIDQSSLLTQNWILK